MSSKKKWSFMVLALGLVGVISCTNFTAENRSKKIISQSSVVDLDGSKLSIAREPSNLEALNDVEAVVVVYDSIIVKYNYKNGDVVSSFELEDLNLGKLHERCIRQKIKFIDTTEFNYFNWEEAKAHVKRIDFPEYVIFPDISVNDTKIAFYLTIPTPYEDLTNDSARLVYSENTHFICEMNEDFSDVKYFCLDHTPHHLKNYKAAFAWAYQGFILEDSTLFVGINAEASPLPYGNRLNAKFHFNGEEFVMDKPLDIPLPEVLTKSVTNLLSSGAPTYYHQKNNKKYVSNGSDVYELETAVKISNELLKDYANEVIKKYAFSENDLYLYYVTYNKDSRVKLLKIKNLSLDKVILEKPFNPRTRMAFFKDQLITLTYDESSEKYNFISYELNPG